MLNTHEQAYLLQLARQSIKTYITDGKPPEVECAHPKLQVEAGAFVSLHIRRRLRGCIGMIKADRPLWKIVIKMAISAATKDNRFSPVTRDELKDIDIEISVLTPLEEIDSPDEVEVGRDGVYLTKGSHSSVFLPQVPVEFRWNRDQYLSQLAKKAGLPEDGWREGCQFQTFQSFRFSESDLHRTS